MKERMVYCGHDLSLTGGEGPIAELGRWPILWVCDQCGNLELDAPSPTENGEKR